jgi:hypothetical protein
LPKRSGILLNHVHIFGKVSIEEVDADFYSRLGNMRMEVTKGTGLDGIPAKI